MAPIPRDSHFDSTLRFARDPYRYVSRQRKRLGSELFETRFMFQKTICMVGRDCVQLIYDPRRFRRRGAAPAAMQKTLLGTSGVQAYDGRRHLDRKRMLLSILYPPDRVAALASEVDQHWERKMRIWARGGYVELYTEAREILFRGICAWAGVPIYEEAFERRPSDVTALFDHAGKIGWGHLRARRRSQQWLAGLVRHIRADRISVSRESAALTARSTIL